jgi:arginine-tRNA-protein transferase
MSDYNSLIAKGFRRSGNYVYRPHCPHCQACIPVRVPVAEFHPSRVQRRIFKLNQDLQVVPQPSVFSAEHYALYQRYIHDRHTDSGMDHAAPQQYLDFLTSAWAHTVFYEFRRDTQLLAVAVVDQLDQALSAVYTFYDTQEQRRSLGVYAVLWQLAQARKLGLNWVYLGYWLGQADKMRYKSRYRPLEAYWEGQWRCYSKQQPLPGETRNTTNSNIEP